MDAISQRPLTLIEIFLTAWSVFTKQFKNIVMVVIIVYVPINIILAFVPLDENSWQSFRVYMRVSEILDGLFGVISSLALIHITERFFTSSEQNDDKKIDFLQALKWACWRWPYFLWTHLTTTLIIGFFTLLLIIPGIIVYVQYIFILPIVALRNIDGAEARAYSKNLVKDQWWKVLGYSLIIGFLGLGLVFGIQFTLGWLTSDIFSEVFLDTVTDIVWAFFEVAAVVLFLNLDYTKRLDQSIDEKM